MPARTITIAGLGDFRQLQTELERTGVISDKSASTMANSSKRAGVAAAEQAKLVGASVDQQVAAAGRASAAFVEAQAKMSSAQKAAARSAAEAGKAAGLSADQQVAAAKRAADAQKKAADSHAALEKTHANISKAGGFVALGAVGVAAAAVKLGEGFQTAQASIQGATSQSVKEVEKLTGAFKGLGAGSQAAVGSGQQMEAAYAGVAGQLKLTEGHALSAAEATKFSAAANNLAESGAANLTEAYSATAKMLQVFHLSADHAGEVTDTLYSTSKAVHVPVEQLASVLGKLHSRLGDVAPSMGDVSGLMVALGEHGLTGGRGVMVANTAFQTLLGGSKKTSEVLRDLGVNVYDSSGKFIGMQNVIGQLQPKLAGLSEQQRRYAEQAIFGKGATEVLGQVIKAGVPAFDQATAAATRHNAAQKAAEAQSKTFHTEMEALKHTVETLGGSLGLVLIPDLQKVAHGLSEGIQWLEKHKAAAQALGLVITGVLGTAMTVFAYDKAVAFGKGVAGMVSGLKSLATSSSVTAGEVGAADSVMVGETDAAAASMKAALITTGIGAALVLLGTAAIELEEHWGSVMKALESAAQSAANFVIGQINGLIKAVNAFTSSISLGLIPAIHEIGSVKIGGGGSGGLTKTQVKGGEQVEAAVQGAKQHVLDTGGGIMAFFEGKGLTPQQAAGIVGNFQQESSLNPNMNTPEGRGLDSGLGSRAHGGTAKQQLEAYWKELQGPEHRALEELKAAGTPEEAARVFSGSSQSGKGFERPSKPEFANREAYARKAFEAHPASIRESEEEAHRQAVLQQQMEEASGARPKKKKAKETVAALGIPAGVVTMLKTAEALVGAPYTWGGGHGSSANDPIEMLKKIGVDCSGFVSKVLSSGGVPGVAGLTTAGLAKNLARGPGKYVTVEDRPEGSQAHTIIDILGKWFESGGKLGGGVQHMTKQQAGAELAGGGFQAFHPAGLNAAVRGGLSATGLKQVTSAAEAAEKAETKRVTALEATAKRLLGEGTQRGNLQSANQSGSVPQLEKILGVSTGGTTGKRLARELEHPLTQTHLEHQIMPTLAKSAAATPTGRGFEKLIAELKAVHTAGANRMVSALEQAHKQALANLGRELYAVTQEKEGQRFSNEATEEKDRTTQAINTSARQLDIVKAESTRQTDAIQAAAKQIEDATQQMKDAFAEMAEAVQNATQEMSDVASGRVQQTQDTTAIEVAKLGERGKYGLELVAQKLEVQLDQMKASYDIQIQQAKMALDQAKTAGQQLIAAKQQQIDLVQAHEDQLAAGAQSQADNVAVTTAITLSRAQGTVDAIQLAGDARIDAALIASVIVATNKKAQQDAAKGFETMLKGRETFAVAGAEAALHTAEGAANAASTAAQTAFAVAQAQGSQAVAEAKEALARTEGEAKLAIVKAEQGLTSIEDTAKVAEAGLEGQVAITRAEAQTQYAGSGLTIQQYGIDFGNATAAANEAVWALTHQLPV